MALEELEHHQVLVAELEQQREKQVPVRYLPIPIAPFLVSKHKSEVSAVLSEQAGAAVAS